MQNKALGKGLSALIPARTDAELAVYMANNNGKVDALRNENNPYQLEHLDLYKDAATGH